MLNSIINFDWEKSFWNFKNKYQFLHVFYIRNKDSLGKITKLLLVRKFEFLSLVIINTDYKILNLWININDRDRLKIE